VSKYDNSEKLLFPLFLVIVGVLFYHLGQEGHSKRINLFYTVIIAS
jgi:hypothetical protein